MALAPNIYRRGDEWYFSCCGKEQGPFPSKGQAEAAASLHAFSHLN